MTTRQTMLCISVFFLGLASGCSRDRTAEPAFQPAYDGEHLVGIRANQVLPESLLAEAGVEPGDVILSINGVAVDSDATSSSILSTFAEEETFTLRVRSPDGAERNATISLPS